MAVTWACQQCFQGKKSVSLKYIKDRVWANIHKWKHTCFSARGKEILIKAVLQAILNYSMSCFKLPMSLIKECNSIMARFWWGEVNEGRKIHWASWRKICVSKFCGGLGFRDLELFNKALLAKQGWRLIENPMSLLCRVLKGKYFKEGSFMEAKQKVNGSFVWNSLLWGRSLLKEGVRWKVGDGKSISVLKDNWIPRPSTLKVLRGGGIQC